MSTYFNCQKHFSLVLFNPYISSATIPGHSGPGSDGNEGVPRTPQSSNNLRTSPSDCLVSYSGHSLGVGSYHSAELQSVYSTVPADWARDHRVFSLKSMNTRA